MEERNSTKKSNPKGNEVEEKETKTNENFLEGKHKKLQEETEPNANIEGEVKEDEEGDSNKNDEISPPDETKWFTFEFHKNLFNEFRTKKVITQQYVDFTFFNEKNIPLENFFD